jgi:choline dehydrogenase
MSLTSYDYIVVGAGAAGCVVASRLSANPATSVLLLEAGGRDWSPLIHMPVGFTKLTSPAVNWGFETVPQKQLNNRAMWYPQGRTLGGSTSINAMIYIRGQREDYDGWAALGNDDWGYEQVLPFFRCAERNERLGGEFHGSDGAMNVTEQVQHNELSKAFVRAGQELGLRYNPDFNGSAQDGVGYYDVTQRNARRESASTAYLRPARGRRNLTIVTHAIGTKVLVEGWSTRSRASTPAPGSTPRWCSAAARSTRPGCCCSRASDPAPSSRSSGSRPCTTCPASARTCRTTWTST